jgi:SAM-dependent methyltransferase
MMLYARFVAFLRASLPDSLFVLLSKVRRITRRRLPDARVFIEQVAGKSGLEVGGPSSLFRAELPLYEVVAELDGVNFAGETMWEGRLKTGRNFRFIENRSGEQFIAEATELAPIADGQYEILLSSNCLEHVANPLKALREWGRVLKPGGVMVLAVPRKENNFDHRRPVTTLEHLLQDEEQQVTEHDVTHLDEILALHDLALDPDAGSADDFRTRSLQNFSNRGLHHHVFDLELAKGAVTAAGFDVLYSTSASRDHIVMARKSCR